MSFVFVSHASQDKPALRPLIDALRGAGLKVWLDNPAAAGYEADEVLSFFRIRAGGRWEDEIDEALREASVVLVCWSKLAVTAEARAMRARTVWFNEAYYARTAGKMVACTIDDLNPADLPGTLSAQQLPCIDPRPSPERAEAVMVTLIDDIKRKIAQRLDARRRNNAPRDAFAPFLADRVEQEATAHHCLNAAVTHGVVRPVLLMGPANERPDEFLLRLRRTSAEVVADGGPWAEVECDWPLGARPREFAKLYRRNLSAALREPGLVDDATIGAALERKGRPVAVLHRFMAKEWGPDEPKRIQRWLDYWQAIEEAVPRLQVVPVLQVKMPSARPGWRQCPAGSSGGRVGNRGIWNAARALARRLEKRGADVLIETPPILSPIAEGDADRWAARLHPEPGIERARLETLLRQLYRKGRPRRHGLAHEEFVAAVAPHFAGESQDR